MRRSVRQASLLKGGDESAPGGNADQSLVTKLIELVMVWSYELVFFLRIRSLVREHQPFGRRKLHAWCQDDGPLKPAQMPRLVAGLPGNR